MRVTRPERMAATDAGQVQRMTLTGVVLSIAAARITPWYSGQIGIQMCLHQ